MHGVETVLNVLGSVTLLLWGVRMVRTGLTRAFGAALRRGIAACSRNRFTAFAGGLGITGLLQSSTATALLVASFAGRGLIAAFHRPVGDAGRQCRHDASPRRSCRSTSAGCRRS